MYGNLPIILAEHHRALRILSKIVSQQFLDPRDPGALKIIEVVKALDEAERLMRVTNLAGEPITFGARKDDT